MTEEIDIQRLSQEQIMQTPSMTDLQPTRSISISDVELNSSQQTMGIEEQNESPDYSSEPVEKVIIKDNTTNNQLNQTWEDQKALGLQPSPSPDSISKIPEYQDTPTRSVIATAPEDFDADKFPTNVGGARIPGSTSLKRHRAGISSHSIGGDFRGGQLA